MANTRGRQVVLVLTNKSGGSVAAGDVVVFDTTADESFTTTTTARAELSVGIAQETIANNAVGRVLVSGYAALVNVPASVTRGHYIETHTVAKQATGNSTRRSGSFGQFAKTSASPSAWLWGQTDQTAASASGSITSSGYTQSTARLLGRTTASTGAIEEITVGSGLSLSAGSLTATGGGGGALVFLAAQTASASASLDFASFISSTYDDYLFEFLNLVPATNNVDFYARFGTGAGPTYDTGANYSNANFAWAATGSAVGGGAGQTAMRLRNVTEIDSNSNGGISGSMKLYYPQSTTTFRRAKMEASYLNGDPVHSECACEYIGNAGTALTAVQFFMSSGNITSGTIRVYGIAKS